MMENFKKFLILEQFELPPKDNTKVVIYKSDLYNKVVDYETWDKFSIQETRKFTGIMVDEINRGARCQDARQRNERG